MDCSCTLKPASSPSLDSSWARRSRTAWVTLVAAACASSNEDGRWTDTAAAAAAAAEDDALAGGAEAAAAFRSPLAAAAADDDEDADEVDAALGREVEVGVAGVGRWLRVGGGRL